MKLLLAPGRGAARGTGRCAIPASVRNPAPAPRPPPGKTPRWSRWRGSRAAGVAMSTSASIASTGCRCAAACSSAERDGHAGQDAELRISASRVAAPTVSITSPRHRARRRPRSGSRSRPWTSREAGTTRSSRSSIPGRNFRSGSSIVARRKAGCTRRWKGRSAARTGRSTYPMRRVDCESGEFIRK